MPLDALARGVFTVPHELHPGHPEIAERSDERSRRLAPRSVTRATTIAPATASRPSASSRGRVRSRTTGSPRVPTTAARAAACAARRAAAMTRTSRGREPRVADVHLHAHVGGAHPCLFSRKKQLFMQVSGHASMSARVRAYAWLFHTACTLVSRASPCDHGSR